MLVLAAAACSHPPIVPAAGARSDTRVPTSNEAVVTDGATAAAAKGRRAAATGTAGNAKLGAVVMLTDRVPIYCTPLERWPADVDGKRVTAHGKLEATDEFAAGSDSAGTEGAVWVLRDCKYDPPHP